MTLSVSFEIVYNCIVRIYKKFFCIALVTILLFIFPLSVFGADLKNDENMNIVEGLRHIESQKDKMGLENVDFSKLKRGNCIYAYNYYKNGLIKTRDIYPLFYNDELVALAFKINNNGVTSYQITTALVKQLNSKKIANKSFALVYDKNGCYLYADGTISLLARSSIISADRKDVETERIQSDFDNITLTKTNQLISLNYSSNDSLRTSSNILCSVGFVSQNPTSYMCWAASIACIVNCVKGRSLTAIDVAKKEYGNVNYNRTLPIGDEQGILRWTYFTIYTYNNYIPSENTMVNNFTNGYPIFGTFHVSNSIFTHAIVLYGINIFSCTLYFMDPEYGFGVIYYASSSSYSYVSAYSNNTLTLQCATCHSWS